MTAALQSLRARVLHRSACPLPPTSRNPTCTPAWYFPSSPPVLPPPAPPSAWPSTLLHRSPNPRHTRPALGQSVTRSDPQAECSSCPGG